MKKLLLLNVGIFLSTLIFGQTYDPNRYVKPILPATTVTTDVLYGSAPQWIWPYWNQDLLMDITVPTNDNNPNRPLIIFAHAGGFINGTKDVDDMVALCDSFAQKGYVTATIEYRKGFDPLDGASAERAVYRGIQDGKTAIRYFKTNHALYNIDTNFIFFGGMSAGAFIALHVGYMDKESERPSSTFGGGTVNDLGCLDCGDYQTGVTSNPFAILDFWGAMQDTALIEPNGPPIQLMHGRHDPTVPFKYGHPFGAVTVPNVYGDSIVQLQLDAVGIYNEYTWSDGPLHMLDGSNNGTWNPAPNSFWSDTLLPKTTNFCYQLIKPQTTIVSPQVVTLCQGETAQFEVSAGTNSHYIWGFDNVNITEITNLNEKTIDLSFPNPGNYTLKVIEFNNLLAAGDTLEFTIEVFEKPIASFISTNNINVTTFTNTSTNGNTYLWDFGDGNTSTDQNPIHIYAANGDYSVSLTTTSADQCVSETITQTVTIESLGIFDITTKINIQNPFTTSLTINTNEILNNVTIYSLDGKMVYSNQSISASTTIETSLWSSGLFILNFESQNGIQQQIKLIKL